MKLDDFLKEKTMCSCAGKMVSEARATGRGHHFVVEMLKEIGAFNLSSIIVTLMSMPVIFLFRWENNVLFTRLGIFWTEAIGIALILIYCRFVEKRSFVSVGFTKNGALVFYLLGLAIGFGIITVVVVAGIMFGALQFAGTQDPINWGLVFLFFSAFIIQGMFEEVLCRGYFMISMARKNSLVIAIVTNSIIFSLMHIGNDGFGVLPFANLFLFGIFASVITLRTDNLWVAGALHSAWNFSLGCFYGLSVSGLEQMPSILIVQSTNKHLLNGGSFGPEGGLLLTVVLIVLILSVLFCGKNKIAEIM